MLHTATPEIAALTRFLCALLEERHPDVVAVLCPQQTRAASAYLGFCHGAALTDPARLLDGTGKALRHVKLTSLEAVQRPELRALILVALQKGQQARGRRGTPPRSGFGRNRHAQV